MTGLDVFVKLTAADYTKGAAQVENANAGIAGSTNSVERSLGRVQALIGGLALGALAKQAGDVAVAFDDALVHVQTLVGESAQQVAAWRDELLSLGPEVGRGPRELAEALYFVTSSGADAAEAMEIVKRSGQAAAIGLGTTAEVARVVTASLQLYSAEGLTAAKATDQLLVAVREGAAEASELGPALGPVIGFAQSLGVSFGEAAAFVATFTKQGVDARRAATGFDSALRALVSNEEQVVKTLRRIGLSTAEFRRLIADKGLAEGLIELRQRLRDTFGDEEANSQLRRIITDVDGYKAVLALTGPVAEDYLRIQREVNEAQGDFGEAVAAAASSPGQAMRELAARAEVLQIAFGDELARAVAAAVSELGGWDKATDLAEDGGRLLGAALKILIDVLDVVANNGELVKNVLVALTAVKVAAWALEAAAALKALGVAASANPIGIVLAGVAVAVYQADQAIDRWSQKSSDDIADITTEANRFGEALKRIPALAEAAIKSGDATRIKAQWVEFHAALLEAQKKLAGAQALASAAPNDEGVRASLTTARLEVQKLQQALAALEAGAPRAATGLRLGAEGMAALAAETTKAGAATTKVVQVEDSVADKYRETVDAISLKISSLELEAAAVGEGATATREAARAVAELEAESKLAEGSTAGMHAAVRKLAASAFDLEAGIEDSTKALEFQRKATAAAIRGAQDLAREQALLNAQTEGGDQAAAELAASIDDYAEAISNGLVVQVGWIQMLSAEGQAFVDNAAAARAAGEARKTLSSRQAEALKRAQELEKAERELATEMERNRILVDEGAAALARYDLELRALAETAAVFGDVDAGLGMGPPTADASAYRDRVFARLSTEGKTQVVEASNEASKEAAEFYVATFSEAMASLARDGWDNWEEVALDTIVRVVEFYEQQQAQMQASQAASGSGGGGSGDSLNAAGSAGAASGSGYGAMIAAAIAFYQMMESRSAQNAAERYGTQISIGGRSFSTGYRGVAVASVSQESEIAGFEARAMARQIEETILSIVSSMGGFVQTLAHMNIQIRNDGEKFVVTVGNWTRTFDDLDTAIQHGIVETLASSTITGLSENMELVLDAARRLGDDLPLAELQAMIEHAQRLDALGLPAVVVDMRRAFEEFQASIRADSRVGFGLDALLEELRVRLQELGDSLRDELESFIPGTDALAQVRQLQELGEAIRAHNDELARQAEAVAELTRQEAILRDNRENPPPPPPGGWPDPGSPGGGANFYYDDIGSTDESGFGWAGFDTFNQIAGEANDAASEAADAVGQLGKEAGVAEGAADAAAAAVNGLSDALPDPIEMAELARAMEALTATQEQQLASLLLDNVSSAGVRARLQRAEHALLMMELESRYEALLLLGTLSADVLATYRAAIDDVAASGGRRGSGQGQQRRDAVEQLRRDAEDVAASLAGATDAAIQYQRSIEDLRKQYADARLGAAETARAVRDLAAVFLRDLAEPFRELSLQAGESDLETQLRQAREQMEDALATALAAAGDNPAAYEAAAQAIRDGFAAQVAAIVSDVLVGLGDQALGLRLQAEETARTITYLLDHLDELGITAEQVADAVRGGVMPQLLEMVQRQAERVGDEQLAADLAEEQAEMALVLERLKFELLIKQLEMVGLIDQELQDRIDEWRGLFDLPTQEGDTGRAGDDALGAPGTEDFTGRTLEELRLQLQDLVDAGVSPALRSLQEWIKAQAELRRELEESAGTAEDIAQLDAALYRTQLLAARGLVDEVEAFLGVPLPVEQTEALARAMFELQRAQLLAALATVEMIAALTTAGVDIQDLIRRITEAEYGATTGEDPNDPRRRPPRTPDGVDRSVDDLERARKALADFVRGLRNDVADPVAASILELQQRLGDLRTQLIAAGGKVSEMAEAEALVAERREQILREAAQGLVDFQRELTFGDLSLATTDQSIQAQIADVLALAERVQAGELSQGDAFADAARDILASAEQEFGVNDPRYDELRRILMEQTGGLLSDFGAGVGGAGLKIDDSRQVDALSMQLAATQAADSNRAAEAAQASFERGLLISEIVTLRDEVAMLRKDGAGQWVN